MDPDALDRLAVKTNIMGLFPNAASPERARTLRCFLAQPRSFWTAWRAEHLDRLRERLRTPRPCRAPAHLGGVQEGTVWVCGPFRTSPVCSAPAQWTRFKACSRTAQRPLARFHILARRRCWASSGMVAGDVQLQDDGVVDDGRRVRARAHYAGNWEPPGRKINITRSEERMLRAHRRTPMHCGCFSSNPCLIPLQLHRDSKAELG